jgi:hypothetical protein
MNIKKVGETQNFFSENPYFWTSSKNHAERNTAKKAGEGGRRQAIVS